MSALQEIASALDCMDEHPNIALAERLIAERDLQGIAEIVAGLDQSAAVAGDCIKVLYEIGDREPALIAEYAQPLIRLLQSKNNRLVWGAMIALGRVAPLNPKQIYAQLDTVLMAYWNGSVITVDNAISVLAQLCKADAAYEKRIMPILIHHFQNCRGKDIPQHLERASVCLHAGNMQPIAGALEKRMGELSNSQQARVRKTLRKIEC